MSRTSLHRLFTPLTINRLVVPNRVVMSALHLNIAGEDMYERMARFYGLRAQDGPGLIVTAGCSPDAPGRAELHGFSIDSDDLIDEHRKITRAVHEAGDSRIALQLLHAGREAFHGRLVGPSPRRMAGSLFKPTALTHDDVLATAAAYAQAARRAVEAGYDAVEVLFSQGFLLHQFLSKHTNERQDEWGGSWANRMRFPLLVACSVREAVGPRYPILFRLPCLDLLEGGLSFEESMQLVEQLEPHGIDLLNVGIGWHESIVPTIVNSVPHAAFAAAACRVKARFPHLLTCASNRVNDLRQAEALLLEGVSDMVALGRPFLADRRLVAKASRGLFDEVNPCIACNQDCLDHLFLSEEVGCSVDAECGSPLDGVEPEPLPPGTTVAVVGGGLAGLSAAWHLRRRGADVTLFESSEALGGQMLLAARVPAKQDFLGTVEHLARNVRRSGVRVLLQRAFAPQDAYSSPWDHVVVATGTVPRSASQSDLFADDVTHESVAVLSGYDLLRFDLPVAFPVVIYGGGGVACDIAKFLLRRAARIDVSEAFLNLHDVSRFVGTLPPLPPADRGITIAQRSSKKIGYRLGRTTRWITIDQLEREGVRMLRNAELRRLGHEQVVFESAAGPAIVPARTLVLATGQTSTHETLAQTLEAAGIPFSVIGSAASTKSEPASISSSIKGGFQLAMQLTVGGRSLQRKQREPAT